MKQLEYSQLETFDTEYVNNNRWEIVKEKIDNDFPDGNFTFLDIGGGNGKFADRLLMAYPQSNGTVIDNSELLLSKNKTHERKTLICDSVANLSKFHQKYDLVCFNWLLHHLVSDSYTQTRQNMFDTVNIAQSLLTYCGRVSIFENMYNGLVIDGLPSHLIFSLTSSKYIASFTKKMGANTAGVGVCFLSKQQWISTLKKSDLQLLAYSDAGDAWSISWVRKLFLHMGKVHEGHFWLSSSSPI
ncbi:hypothetical protein CAL7716_043320 [Calothrix sp. PCC 7716]|nr:hypothetical protein CAL7716_043320 [Calothrix sp. PCC 7716]